jgi:hypothetical protein
MGRGVFTLGEVALPETIISPPAHREAGCVCPRCGNQYLIRLARCGFLENKLLPLFGYYPWICSACRTRKYFRTRGKRIPRTFRAEERGSESK